MNTTIDYDYDFDFDNFPCKSALPEKARNSIKTISLILYCLTCVLGLPGNTLVVWIAGVKMKRTVNTVWFLNLAIADLLCCLSIPFIISEILLEYHWPYGDIMCKLLPTVIVLNMFASVFTLNLISVDRFVQVVKPVWAQNNRKLGLAWVCCAVVWSLAVFLSLPTVILRETLTVDDFTICTFSHGNLTEEGCGFDKGDSYRALIMTRLVFGFLIPFLCIVCCYALIAWKVSSSQFRTGRAFRIMIAVVVAFFLSWLPYHVVGLVNIYGKEWESSFAQEVDPLAISLAYVNSCMNPILYVFMGHDFKDKVKLSLRRVFERAFSENGTHSSVNSRGGTSRCTNSSDTQL
ncbi:C3a anaphylatoxin chemotactic receptor [Trichomycterus rosablanca]|uniref:C3a anaphylatoxin chemotactic receptor n=1 Tax=Trichomycterus rosablanca TaxID=2290929 RepID=UPI002F35BD2C